MKKMNFLELINTHGIKIPLIQRDYAQGREKETVKAQLFLKAIKKGIKNGLNLDFIYGQVEKENNVFTPLDGQQRLTTLFLIHWYLSLENEYMEALKKFTYEVRSSTKDFLKELTKQENFEKIRKNKVVKNIENSNWFFISWKKDPTVVALLNMLDLIEDNFYDINVEELNKITFEFLNLDEFNLTDELYVKMNARGKPLTKFENFKAEFLDFNFFKEHNKTKIKYASKIDNDWLDIFWDIAKQESADDITKAPSKSDMYFYNFFENLTVFFTLESLESLDKFNLLEFKFDESHIKDIEIILDCIAQYSDNDIHHIRDINIFKDFLKPYIKNDARQSISYEQRARFYALMQFFLKKGCLVDENIDIFKRWMRVNINLINNIRYDTIRDFKNIVSIIDQLSYKIDDVYTGISNLSLKNESNQFKEEKLKANLIISSSVINWEKELLEAEKHWYLDGQIKFLLAFSEMNLNKFQEYRNNFFILFDRKKLYKGKDDNYDYQTLIHRALLTFEDYLPNHKGSEKYTFCVYDDRLRIKNENWRNVFNRDCFKSLLEKIDNDIEKSLMSIINAYPFTILDWKSYFINPNRPYEIISFAKNYQVEKLENNTTIYLNRGYNNNPPAEKWGWARVGELYSYYLFKKEFEQKIIEPFSSDIRYWASSNPSEEKPCIMLEDWLFHNHSFTIEIWYEDGYFITFLDKNSNSNHIAQEIIEVLTQNSFLRESDYYRFIKKLSLGEENKIFNIIKKLSNDLMQVPN